MSDRRRNSLILVIVVALLGLSAALLATNSTKLLNVPRTSTWAPCIGCSASSRIAGMRDHGYVEGRDYVVQEGDVIQVRFNV